MRTSIERKKLKNQQKFWNNFLTHVGEISLSFWMKLLSFYDIGIPLIYQVGVKKDDTLFLLQNDQNRKKAISILTLAAIFCEFPCQIRLSLIKVNLNHGKVNLRANIMCHFIC